MSEALNSHFCVWRNLPLTKTSGLNSCPFDALHRCCSHFRGQSLVFDGRSYVNRRIVWGLDCADFRPPEITSHRCRQFCFCFFFHVTEKLVLLVHRDVCCTSDVVARRRTTADGHCSVSPSSLFQPQCFARVLFLSRRSQKGKMVTWYVRLEEYYYFSLGPDLEETKSR